MDLMQVKQRFAVLEERKTVKLGRSLSLGFGGERLSGNVAEKPPLGGV